MLHMKVENMTFKLQDSIFNIQVYIVQERTIRNSLRTAYYHDLFPSKFSSSFATAFKNVEPKAPSIIR